MTTSSFPTGLDSIATNKAAHTQQFNDHHDHHNLMASAINAIEAWVQRKGPQLVVAANDAPAAVRAAADYTCDGTADEVQIQAAIDALNAGVGGEVLLTPGTFNIAATIAPKDNVRIKGSGVGATFLEWAGGTSSNMIASATTSCLVRAAIESMTLDCNSVSTTPAIYAISPQWCIFRDLDITGVSGIAAFRVEAIATTADGIFDHANAVFNHFEDIRFRGCQGFQFSGAGLSATPVGLVTNNTFVNIDIIEVPASGIGLRFVQWADSNHFYHVYVGLLGANSKGIVFNDSATPAAVVGVYNNQFHGLSMDHFSTGHTAIEMNVCQQIVITGFLHSPSWDATVINDVSDRAYSYDIQLTNENDIERHVKGISPTVTITPSQITADQNDYYPTTGRAADIWRISSDAVRTITGIVGGYLPGDTAIARGRHLQLHNVGSFDIFLANESASSTAKNRISTGTGQAWRLRAGGSCDLVYDGTSERWRVTGGSGHVQGQFRGPQDQNLVQMMLGRMSAGDPTAYIALEDPTGAGNHPTSLKVLNIGGTPVLTLTDAGLLAPSGAIRIPKAIQPIGALTVTNYIEVEDSGGTVRKLAVVS